MSERLVHVIDDEDAVRRGVGFLLKTSGYLVRSWSCAHDFLHDLRHREPGCILLDVRMPEIDGLQLQQILRDRGVTMPVVVMTGHGDVGIAVQVMKAGAVDLLEKPFDRPELRQALDAAFARLESAATIATREAEADVLVHALTARERDVLCGLALGYPNKTIAYDLSISPRTVEVHRANLMTKFGARSLSEVLRIAFAARMGEQAWPPPPAMQEIICGAAA